MWAPDKGILLPGGLPLSRPHFLKKMSIMTHSAGTPLVNHHHRLADFTAGSTADTSYRGDRGGHEKQPKVAQQTKMAYSGVQVFLLILSSSLWLLLCWPCCRSLLRLPSQKNKKKTKKELNCCQMHGMCLIVSSAGRKRHHGPMAHWWPNGAPMGPQSSSELGIPAGWRNRSSLKEACDLESDFGVRRQRNTIASHNGVFRSAQKQAQLP